MSKERLEEIERLRGIDRRLIAFEHTDWLIEQAKRVEELESQVENWQKGRHLAISTIDKEREFKKRIQELEDAVESYKKTSRHANISHKMAEEQNKRYREALEFYADKENYKPFDGIFLSSYQNKVDEDGGEIARKALKGRYEW